DADARREEILLDVHPARRVVAAQTADQQLIGREVEHLHAAVSAHRNRVVLPPQTGGDRDLSIHLPLIADVQAVFPAPLRERPILAGAVLTDERAEERRLT